MNVELLLSSLTCSWAWVFFGLARLFCGKAEGRRNFYLEPVIIEESNSLIGGGAKDFFFFILILFLFFSLT